MSRQGWRERASRLAAYLLVAGLLQGSGAEQSFAASSNSFISGTVFVDENQNGTKNRDDDGKSDVMVTLKPDSGSGDRQRTRTDKKGVFEFTDLAAGKYRLTVSVPDNYSSTTSEQLEVKVDGKNGTRVADFGLVKESAVSPVATPVSSGSTTQSGNGSSSGGNPASGGPISGAGAPAAPTATGTQRLASLAAIRSAHFLLQGRSDDNGRVADFLAEGNVLQPGDLDMYLALGGEELNTLIVGQKAYQRSLSEQLWTPMSLSTLRSWHGVLLAIDVINLQRLAGQILDVRTLEWGTLDGAVVQRYEIVVGPSSARSSAAGGAGQLTALDGLIELWVTAGDNLIQQAHVQLAVASSREDLDGRVAPATLDAWLRFTEQNTAFTINEPAAIAQPAPVSSAGRSSPPPVSVPPQPMVQPMPRPVAPAEVPPQAAPAETSPKEAPSQPTAAAPTATEEGQSASARDAAADRALAALASASGPRSGSHSEPNRVELAVPWRNQLLDPPGSSRLTDGAASLGMILEAFGLTTSTADLEALAERWQDAWKPGQQIDLATLRRIGERGSLRPLGPSLGSGGGDWSAALARDFLRRGYPVLARVHAALMPDAPRPTATPAPARTLYDERFADNQRGWPSDSQSTAWLADGAYRLLARQPGQFVAIGAPTGHPLRDAVVTAAFRKVEGPAGGGYGLILRDRRTEPRDGRNQNGPFYVFGVGDRGEVGAWQRDGDHWVDLVPWTHADAVHPGNATNELVVKSTGQQFTFLVNGVQVFSLTDGALGDGAAGVFVVGDLNEVLVDRFQLQSQDQDAASGEGVAAAPAAQADRYIVLTGFDGDDLLYLDPSQPDGSSHRVQPAALNRAWAAATPPFRGLAFGFGTNVVGLLDAAPRSVTAAITPTAVPLPELAIPTLGPEPTDQPVARDGATAGLHPALLGFLALLTTAVGFVLARLIR